VSQWTVDTLKEYFDAILVEKDKAITAALAAADRAAAKVETATTSRFDTVNEFRQTLTDQQATFVTRLEWGTARDDHERRLRKVEDSASGVAANRALLVVLFTLVIAAAGIVAALVA